MTFQSFFWRAMRWVLAAFFIGAGVNHFINAAFYRSIVPPWLPRPDLLVVISGVAEILGGTLLLHPRTRRVGAIGLMLLLVAVFPANVHMALNPELFPQFHEPLLWVRLPMQGVILFLLWPYAYYPEPHVFYLWRMFRRGESYGRAFIAGVGAGESGSTHNPFESFARARITGPGLWKWTHYYDIYHRHLSRFIGKPVTVLEIGVCGGGSLDMWRAVLGPDCRVHGLDIRPWTKRFEGGAVRIHIGDQGDRHFLSRVAEEAGGFDVVIDDGSHDPAHQIASLEVMLPRLKPGGVYLCEDVHWGRNPFSAHVSGLVSHLNEHNDPLPNGLQRDIHSVHFYPYVTVIEKREAALAVLTSERRGTEWPPA